MSNETYKRVALAMIDMDAQGARVYHLTADSIGCKFFVQNGNGRAYATHLLLTSALTVSCVANTFSGTLSYNDAKDLSGDQLSVVSASDNKLVIYFKDGDSNAAKVLFFLM